MTGFRNCVDVAAESKAWPVLVWRDAESFDRIGTGARNLGIAVVRTLAEALDQDRAGRPGLLAARTACPVRPLEARVQVSACGPESRIPSPESRVRYNSSVLPADPPQPSRAESVARLFEAVHEGVLRRPARTARQHHHRGEPVPPDHARLPGRHARGVAAPVRARPVHRRGRAVFFSSIVSPRDGAVTDYLLRLRRADDAVIWVEVTASAVCPGVDRPGAHRGRSCAT